MITSSKTSYAVQSKELVEIEVSAGGARILAGVKFGLLLNGESRQSIVWETPTTIGQRFGLKLNGVRTPGIYEVWAFVENSEEPWVPCGNITLY